MSETQQSIVKRKIKQNQKIFNQQHETDNVQYDGQQIVIKNLDSGNHEVFNIQQVDELGDQLKDLLLHSTAQTRISLWNSYWEEHTKIDTKLLRLVLSKEYIKLDKLLKEQPIQLNLYKFIDGWTLIHHAVVSSTQNIVQLLIDYKIEVNSVTNEMKRTALHEAVLSNKLDIVKLLIKNSADPNIQDTDGNTAIHYAAEVSNIQIFQILIKSSLQLNLQLINNHQMTILDCIRDQRMLHILQQFYPDVINNPNQNYHNLQNLISLQNRRIIKTNDGTIVKRISKSDLIQKFLSMKSIQRLCSEDLTQSFQDQENNNDKNHENNNNNNKNLEKQSIGSIKSLNGGRKNKIKVLGSRRSNWIDKKGKSIVQQSIFMMKQSVIEIDTSGLSLQNYGILRHLGSGGFAQVFLARRKKSTKLYAIKRIAKSKIVQNNLKRYVYAERNIMLKCIHPFIVQAFSMFQDNAYLYISMEYCECGDLEKLISTKGKISEEQVRIYAAQIGLALEYIHSKNILFRDLKSANVLIGKDGYLKISDFGLAKESRLSFSFLGSVQYLAPQMLVETDLKEHTNSIDWYLYGVLLYQMLTGRPPFYGQKQHILFKKIKEVRPPIPNYLSKECKQLLSSLLEKNPSNRLGLNGGFQQISKNSWFTSIDFEKMLKKQYEVPFIEPIISQEDLHKKIPIDDYTINQKQQYFREWNYIKST